MTLRLMLSFGVRCPLASVSSVVRIVNLRIDSARDTVSLAASIARCTSASTAAFGAASSSDMPASSPLLLSHTGSISGSSVMSAEMKGFVADDDDLADERVRADVFERGGRDVLAALP